MQTRNINGIDKPVPFTKPVGTFELTSQDVLEALQNPPAILDESNLFGNIEEAVNNLNKRDLQHGELTINFSHMGNRNVDEQTANTEE